MRDYLFLIWLLLNPYLTVFPGFFLTKYINTYIQFTVMLLLSIYYYQVYFYCLTRNSTESGILQERRCSASFHLCVPYPPGINRFLFTSKQNCNLFAISEFISNYILYCSQLLSLLISNWRSMKSTTGSKTPSATSGATQLHGR